MGTCKREDEGLPNLIPIWYIQLAPIVLTTTAGLTFSYNIICTNYLLSIIFIVQFSVNVCIYFRVSIQHTCHVDKPRPDGGVS